MSEIQYTGPTGRVRGNVWFSVAPEYRVHGVIDESRRAVTLRNGRRTIHVRVAKKAVLISSTDLGVTHTLIIPIEGEEDEDG